MNDWFSRTISIDELKNSALVIVLFIFVGFGCYSLITKGDLPSNLTMLIEINIGAIAGVNAFSFVGNGFGMSKNQNGIPMQNQYGYSNSYSPYGNSSMGFNGMGMSGMNTLPINNPIISPTGQVQQTTTTSSMPKPY